jgi:hypothetical protein
MFDWMTWCIEGVGIVILCIWIVVPIAEFKTIFRRLKLNDNAPDQPADGTAAE